MCTRKSVDINPEKDLRVQYASVTNEITSNSNPAIVTLQRTMCYGTCPLYTVGIFKDGTVKYWGAPSRQFFKLSDDPLLKKGIFSTPATIPK